MAGHEKDVDSRIRTIRYSTVAVVWIAGLAAGFVGFLATVARYGCTDTDHGFGCRRSGSIVGLLVVLAVVAIVAAVTLMVHDRPVRRVLIVGGVGLLAIAICFAAATGLLSTT